MKTREAANPETNVIDEAALSNCPINPSLRDLRDQIGFDYYYN